ncbi:hypothetical protein Tco_0014746 [Tanacetum coccineum]
MDEVEEETEIGMVTTTMGMETMVIMWEELCMLPVKYATCTLQNGALTWWNYHKRIVRTDAFYEMAAKEFIRLMTEVCCLRNEVQKMESELWNLTVKGSGVGSIRRIQCLGYGVLGFLKVGTTFDIFQNIHILYLQYGVLVFSGYGVLIIFPLWSLVSAGTDTPYLP